MPTTRSNHWEAHRVQGIAEVACRGDAVLQVVVGYGLLEPLGNGFEVSTSETTVGREAFGENQHGPSPLGEQLVVGG